MFTKQMQFQAIADLLAGVKRSRPNLEQFDEHLRAAYLAAEQAEQESRLEAFTNAIAGHPECNTIIGAVVMAEPGASSQFESLAELAKKLRPVEWLWPGWMPLGMVSMLGAAPGAGKSLVALDIARRIIQQDNFPDGTPVPFEGARVIYADAESIPQVHNERADGWHMDKTQLYLMLPRPNELIDFMNTTDCDILVEMMHAINPLLLIVDSLSTITTRGENSVEDVRGVFRFLGQVAEDFNCALLLIHHLRKRGPLATTDALSIDDFRGSSHIIAASRSVLGLTVIKDESDNDRNRPRRLEVIKTNLAGYPKPLGLEFLPMEPSGVLLKYGDPPEPYRKPVKQDECEAWLLEVLGEYGPLKSSEIIDMAVEDGFSRTMVFDARKAVGEAIRDTVGPRQAGNRWALAGEDLESGDEEGPLTMAELGLLED